MNPLTPHPDPMPLREVLRGLRHSMRRSRRVLRETVTADVLPGPAARIAQPVLDGLDALAEGVDVAGSGLAKRLLGAKAHHVPRLETLLVSPDGEEVFAEATYEALRGALHRMGNDDAFVSEATARRSFAAVTQGRTKVRTIPQVAAYLAFVLLDGTVIRDVALQHGTHGHADPIAPLAVVATLLWLMTDRDRVDPDGALDAASDIAVALAEEVVRLVTARDEVGLAQLLDEYAAHV